MAKLIKIRTYTTKRTGEAADVARGYLSILENNKDIPFEVKRVFYIYGSNHVERGGHRHIKTRQALICTSGSYSIYTNNGVKKETYVLSSPDDCLLLEPADWHTMVGLDETSVLLVLSSELYNLQDYIDDEYPDFIEYENLYKVNKEFMNDYKAKFDEVLNSGYFVLGNNVKNFEQEFQNYLQSGKCLGVANGLDALTLSLLALKNLDMPADSEVIVPSNTYIATILAILNAGLKPVLVEPDITTYNIDPTKIAEKITKKTKAIMPVHLYGKSCDMTPILKIANDNGLVVIEDCAQSHGAMYKGVKTGTFGDFGAFSFYPTKNLGALGDAGAVIFKNYMYYDKVMALRNYGSFKKYYNDYVGINSRLDEVQAGFLSVKLKSLDKINAHKRKLADIYNKNLSDKFIKPIVDDDYFDVYHIYAIRHERRDELKKYLLDNGIKTDIHYPLPPHKQKAMQGILTGDYPIAEKIHETILSLPISYSNTEAEIYKVVEVMNKFEALA